MSSLSRQRRCEKQQRRAAREIMVSRQAEERRSAEVSRSAALEGPSAAAKSGDDAACCGEVFWRHPAVCLCRLGVCLHSSAGAYVANFLCRRSAGGVVRVPHAVTLLGPSTSRAFSRKKGAGCKDFVWPALRSSLLVSCRRRSSKVRC